METSDHAPEYCQTRMLAPDSIRPAAAFAAGEDGRDSCSQQPLLERTNTGQGICPSTTPPVNLIVRLAAPDGIVRTRTIADFIRADFQLMFFSHCFGISAQRKDEV